MRTPRASSGPKPHTSLRAVGLNPTVLRRFRPGKNGVAGQLPQTLNHFSSPCFLRTERRRPKRPEGRRATAALPTPPLPAAVRSSAARTWPQPCHRPMASDPSSFPLSFPPTSGGGHGWPGKEVAALPRLSRRRARSPDGERAAVERADDSALSSEPATHTSDVPTAGGGGSYGYRAPASRRSVLSHAAPQRPR